MGLLPPPDELAPVRALDEAAAQAMECVRTPALDAFVYRLSSAADHSLLWFTAAAIRAAPTGDVDLFVRFAVAMGLESALTNGPVKGLFRRSRPEGHVHDGGPLPYGMRLPITSSFPSGHAAAAFLSAALLARTTSSPAGRAGWYGLAGAVAVSRLYTRMHHLSDIVVGAAFGWGLAHAMSPWFARRA